MARKEIDKEREAATRAAKAALKQMIANPPTVTPSPSTAPVVTGAINTGYLNVSGISGMSISSGSSLSSTGTATVQTTIAPSDELRDATWESVINAAVAWANMGHPDRAQVLLSIATEIRKHERQQAKLFKKLKKQLEQELEEEQ